METGPFGNCKTAELHKNLQVQAYGGLIAIDKRTHQIVACSQNIQSFVGQDAQSLLGTPWSGVLTPDLLETLFAPPDSLNSHICRTVHTELNGRNISLANHMQGNYCIVELEPTTEDTHTGVHFNQKVALLQALANSKTVEQAGTNLTNEIARLIDFDRVMLYKFMPGWHGEVIAEKNKAGIDGYLGLRFPEGDIPANARRLFTINLQRLIANVADKTSGILVANDAVDLDLSFAQLRAVHPVHIKYLNNMGVQASFSLSLVCNGQLWGMIACHNLSPKILPIKLRQDCEELARITSMQMSSMLVAIGERKRHDYLQGISALRAALNIQKKGVNTLNSHIGEIRELFRASGIWHSFRGKDVYSGNVPDSISLSTLENWLAKFTRNDIMALSIIPEELKDNPSLLRFASGMLYIPMANNEFILMFRPEQVEQVEWAGKPHSLTPGDTSTAALTPRSSFIKWSQELRGHSEPWESQDIEAAKILGEELQDYLARSDMEEMAMQDSLTGLANRMRFERNLESAVRQSIEDESVFAVFMIDLDNFKPVNDSMGHAAGDELLIQVGNRITALLREEDSVARLGGDEFAVILRNIKEQQRVELIANRLLAEMTRSFDIAGKSVQIGASIGISICPHDASSESELLQDADMALYKVKEEGRNNFKRFDKSMLTGEGNSDSIRENLLDAFAKEQFTLHFQPIVNIASRKLTGFESFCVWQHPEKGTIRAREYIDLIRKAQLTSHWAEWGLKQLYLYQSQWARSGRAIVPIGLNMDAKQFLNMDILGLCQSLAEQYQLGSTWLRLDLEEQTLLMNPKRVAEKVASLAEEGVLVNIDHFGSGLTSVGQLTELKLNALKVPGKFMEHYDKNHQIQAQLAILKSIAKVINVPLIATQVEDEAALKAASKNGIDRCQGFIYGGLFAPDDMPSWLDDCELKLQSLKL